MKREIKMNAPDQKKGFTFDQLGHLFSADEPWMNDGWKVTSYKVICGWHGQIRSITFTLESS